MPRVERVMVAPPIKDLAARDAEIARLQARVSQCVRCGGDYATTGLSNECPCLQIARLRAVLEWIVDRSPTHAWQGQLAGCALHGNWPAVRAAGVALPEEEPADLRVREMPEPKP